MIVASTVGVCVCSMFCCVSLYVFSCLAIIFMRLGRESRLLCIVCLPVVLCLLYCFSSQCRGLICNLDCGIS